ncbi:Crp/Fnr family transcriptional regulator [Candidatus Omnitrophota bacterium]
MANYLKKIPLFSLLDDEELEAIYKQSSTKQYPKNNFIILENDEGDTLYIILKGKVKVTKIFETGDEIILSVLDKGNFFGEMSLLDGKPRSANVVTLEDTTLRVINRHDFENFLEMHPKIALKLLRELTSRLRKADERIGSLAHLNVTGRIADFLIQLANERGESSQEGIVIKSRPRLQDIANTIGTKRETVSRILKQLETKRYIRIIGKDIILLEVDIFRQTVNL